MVGELFPLHNLEILGDILTNFEPLFKHLLRKIVTTLKKQKQKQQKQIQKHMSYNDNSKLKLQLTFTMYKLPIFQDIVQEVVGHPAIRLSAVVHSVPISSCHPTWILVGGEEVQHVSVGPDVVLLLRIWGPPWHTCHECEEGCGRQNFPFTPIQNWRLG